MINKDQLYENIISLLGIQNLPDEKKIAFLERMADLIQKRILTRILEQLDESAQHIFVEAANANDEFLIKEVLVGANISLEALIKEEVLRLKEEMKSAIDGLGV